MWYYPLVHKSDVYATFSNFVTMVERQFNTKLKRVQTDWGGEFCNLSPFFNKLGIIHRRSCPYTSEQNGIVERHNRHVVETGLALLAHSSLPHSFWHFAFETAVYLINRLPSRTLSNKSPFHILYHRKRDYSFLRVFGCPCFPYLRSYNRHKRDFRSTSCVFLGYSPHHHGYRCFDPATDTIYIVRHVRFNKTVFPFQISSHQPSPSPATSDSPYVSLFPDPVPQPTPEPIPPSLTTTTSDPPSPQPSTPSPFTALRSPSPPPPPRFSSFTPKS